MTDRFRRYGGRDYGKDDISAKTIVANQIFSKNGYTGDFKLTGELIIDGNISIDEGAINLDAEKGSIISGDLTLPDYLLFGEIAAAIRQGVNGEGILIGTWTGGESRTERAKVNIIGDAASSLFVSSSADSNVNTLAALEDETGEISSYQLRANVAAEDVARWETVAADGTTQLSFMETRNDGDLILGAKNARVYIEKGQTLIVDKDGPETLDEEAIIAAAPSLSLLATEQVAITGENAARLSFLDPTDGSLKAMIEEKGGRLNLETEETNERDVKTLQIAPSGVIMMNRAEDADTEDDAFKATMNGSVEVTRGFTSLRDISGAFGASSLYCIFWDGDDRVVALMSGSETHVFYVSEDKGVTWTEMTFEGEEGSSYQFDRVFFLGGGALIIFNTSNAVSLLVEGEVITEDGNSDFVNLLGGGSSFLAAEYVGGGGDTFLFVSESSRRPSWGSLGSSATVSSSAFADQIYIDKETMTAVFLDTDTFTAHLWNGTTLTSSISLPISMVPTSGRFFGASEVLTLHSGTTVVLLSLGDDDNWDATFTASSGALPITWDSKREEYYYITSVNSNIFRYSVDKNEYRAVTVAGDGRYPTGSSAATIGGSGDNEFALYNSAHLSFVDISALWDHSAPVFSVSGGDAYFKGDVRVEGVLETERIYAKGDMIEIGGGPDAATIVIGRRSDDTVVFKGQSNFFWGDVEIDASIRTALIQALTDEIVIGNTGNTVVFKGDTLDFRGDISVIDGKSISVNAIHSKDDELVIGLNTKGEGTRITIGAAEDTVTINGSVFFSDDGEGKTFNGEVAIEKTLAVKGNTTLLKGANLYFEEEGSGTIQQTNVTDGYVNRFGASTLNNGANLVFGTSSSKGGIIDQTLTTTTALNLMHSIRLNSGATVQFQGSGRIIQNSLTTGLVNTLGNVTMNSGAVLLFSGGTSSINQSASTGTNIFSASTMKGGVSLSFAAGAGAIDQTSSTGTNILSSTRLKGDAGLIFDAGTGYIDQSASTGTNIFSASTLKGDADLTFSSGTGRISQSASTGENIFSASKMKDAAILSFGVSTGQGGYIDQTKTSSSTSNYLAAIEMNSDASITLKGTGSIQQTSVDSEENTLGATRLSADSSLTFAAGSGRIDQSASTGGENSFGASRLISGASLSFAAGNGKIDQSAATTTNLLSSVTFNNDAVLTFKGTGYIDQKGSTGLNTFSRIQQLNIGSAGSNNVAFGKGSMNSVTTGINNTAFGTESLSSNQTGQLSTAVGCLAGYSSLASNCSFLGGQCGQYVTGANNTAVGTVALRGVSGGTNTGTNNAAFGQGALSALTSGSRNVGVGQASVPALTTGEDNTGVGHNVMPLLTTGIRNTSVGRLAGKNITTSSNNTCIGYNSGFSSTSDLYSGSTCIGYSSIIDESNAIILGTASEKTKVMGHLHLNTDKDIVFKGGAGKIDQSAGAGTNLLSAITLNSDNHLTLQGTGKIIQAVLSSAAPNTLGHTQFNGNATISFATGTGYIDQSAATGTNILSAITLNTNSDITLQGTGKIVQSGGTNNLSAITLNTNSDITFQGTGKLTQSTALVATPNTLGSLKMYSGAILSFDTGTGYIDQTTSTGENIFSASKFKGDASITFDAGSGRINQTSSTGINIFSESRLKGDGDLIFDAGNGKIDQTSSTGANTFSASTMKSGASISFAAGAGAIDQTLSTGTNTFNGSTLKGGTDLTFASGTGKIDQTSSTGTNTFSASTMKSGASFTFAAGAGAINQTSSTGINIFSESRLKGDGDLIFDAGDGKIDQTSSTGTNTFSASTMKSNASLSFASGTGAINQTSSTGINIFSESRLKGDGDLTFDAGDGRINQTSSTGTNILSVTRLKGDAGLTFDAGSGRIDQTSSTGTNIFGASTFKGTATIPQSVLGTITSYPSLDNTFHFSSSGNSAERVGIITSAVDADAYNGAVEKGDSVLFFDANALTIGPWNGTTYLRMEKGSGGSSLGGDLEIVGGDLDFTNGRIDQSTSTATNLMSSISLNAGAGITQSDGSAANSFAGNLSLTGSSVFGYRYEIAGYYGVTSGMLVPFYASVYSMIYNDIDRVWIINPGYSLIRFGTLGFVANTVLGYHDNINGTTQMVVALNSTDDDQTASFKVYHGDYRISKNEIKIPYISDNTQPTSTTITSYSAPWNESVTLPTPTQLYSFDNTFAPSIGSGTWVNTARVFTTSPHLYGTHALSFVNATTYASANTSISSYSLGSPATNGFAFSFWVYPTTFASGATIFPTFVSWLGSGGNDILRCGVYAESTDDMFINFNGNIFNSAFTNTSMALNQWNFYAVSVSAPSAGTTTIIIQVNNFYSSTTTTSQSFSNFTTTSGTLLLGNLDTTTPCRWAGQMDQLRFYQRSLTVDEISALYIE